MAGLLQPDSQWDPMWGRLCSPSAMSVGWERQQVVSLVKITSIMAWNLGMLEVQEVRDLEWMGSVYSDASASWLFLGLKLLCHLRGVAKFRRVKEKISTRVCQGCWNKASEQEQLIVSQFWRPEVWNQGVRRTVLPPKALGNDLFQFRPLPYLSAVPWLMVEELQSSHSVAFRA